MLLIHHKGIHIFSLDTTNFTGDVEEDGKQHVLGLEAGKMAGVDANGKIQLADGDPAAAKLPSALSLMMPLVLLHEQTGYRW